MKSSEKLTADGNRREMITFTVGQELYGIDILKVQEIRGYDRFTSIVNTPEFINGVINLRGASVPIVDVRVKFQSHTGRKAYSEPIAIIILDVAKCLAGIVVDGVSDVIALAVDQIKPVSESGHSPHMKFIAGHGSVRGRNIHVLDIEKLAPCLNTQHFSKSPEMANLGAGTWLGFNFVPESISETA
ncbi:MAG: chemotaxis protein CheW [Gallionella sp.]|nr:chemotaxis protein CheW [Gallionella sp.]